MGNTPSVTKPVQSSLTDEIKALTKSYDAPKITKFYNTNLKVFNKQIGNKEVYEALMALRNFVLTRTKSPQTRELAFQIYWTATSLQPDGTIPWSELPLEIWKRIFPQEPLTLNNLLISNQLSQIAHARINQEWTCFKSMGFKTSSGAIEYAIKYNLTSLDLRNLGKVDLALLQKFANNCPNARVLGIHDSTLSGAEMVPILKQLPKLQRLDLHVKSDTSILAPISEMTELMTLSLNGFKGDICELPVKLLSLMLISCTISDNTLVEALGHCPNLLTLGIIQCSSVSGTGLVEIAKKIGKLRILDLSGCTQISPMSIEQAVAYLPQLRELHLNGTNIQYDQLEKIVQKLLFIQCVVVNGTTWKGRENILNRCKAAQVPDDIANVRVD